MEEAAGIDSVTSFAAAQILPDFSSAGERGICDKATWMDRMEREAVRHEVRDQISAGDIYFLRYRRRNL